MPLSLESALTLALGPFNPYIINPEWLVKNKICEDGEVEIRLLPLSQGMAFSFSHVQWQVDFRHLMAASLEVDCGPRISRVIELLEHTPVMGVGNNFQYACSREEWGDSPLPMLGGTNSDISNREGWLVEQTRWSCVLRSGDARIEVTIAREDLGMVVLFNFHRETPNPGDAVAAARKFSEDRDTSVTLIREIFGQEVKR